MGVPCARGKSGGLFTYILEADLITPKLLRKEGAGGSLRDVAI